MNNFSNHFKKTSKKKLFSCEIYNEILYLQPLKTITFIELGELPEWPKGHVC